MGAVLTQNNLIEVITAEVKGLNDIINLITSSAVDTIAKLPKSWNNTIKQYKTILKDIFGDSGLIYDIQDSLSTLDKKIDITQLDNVFKSKILSKTFTDFASVFESFNNIKINIGVRLKILLLKQQLKAISSLTDVLEEANLSLKQAIINRISPDGLKDTIADIQEVFNIIENIKINVLLIFKIKWIKFAIGRIKKLVKEITSLSNDITLLVKSLITFKLLTSVLFEIQSSINYISTIKINLMIVFKIKLIKFAVNQINKLIDTLTRSSQNPFTLFNSLTNLVMLNTILAVLQQVVNNIQALKIGLNIIIKFWFVKKIVTKINDIVAELAKTGNKIKSYAAVLKRWSTIMIMIYLFKNVINILVKTKTPHFFKKKLKGMLKSIIIIKQIVEELSSAKVDIKSINKINDLIKIFKRLHVLFRIINTTALFTILAPISLIPIIMSLASIRLFVILISVIFKGVRLKNIIKQFRKLNTIFRLLSLVLYNIVLISPIALLAIPAILVITISLSLILLSLKLTTMLMKGLINGKTILGFIQLSFIFDIILLIAVKLVLISIAAMIVSANAMNILIFFGILITVTVAVGLLGFALGSFISILAIILIGLLGLTIIFTMLLVIAVELLALSLLALPIAESSENILIFFKTLLDITISLGKMGWSMLKNAIPLLLVVPGLMLMTIVISLITFIAIELLLIQALPVDGKLIKEKVEAVISTVHYIIDSIFNAEDPDNQESDKSWITKVVEFLGIDKLIMIIDAIMAVSFLATTLCAVTMIVGISLMLLWLQNINLDPTAITTNVNLVVDTALMVIDSLFNRPEPADNPTEKSWISKVVSTLGLDKLKSILDAITAVGFLAVSMVSVMLITELATQLNTIQNVKLDKNKIQEQVGAVVSTAAMVSSSILNSQNDNDIKIKDLKNIIKYVGKSNKIFKRLNKSAKFLSKIGEYDTTTLNNGKNNVLTVLNSIKDFTTISDTNTKNAKNILKDYTKFIKRIDKVDTDKLSNVSTMFENMAKFSESINGNFDKLADALTEKIAPVLEELKELLGEIPEKIDNNASSVSSSIYASNSPTILTQEGMTEQVQRESGASASPQDVDRIVQQRLKDSALAQSRSVESKLDELLDLLRSGSVQIKVGL